jgi:hypothetical protein
MMPRWTLLLISVWILFAAPVVPAPAAAPAVVCAQAQRVEYSSVATLGPSRPLPLPLPALAPALPPYQPAPQNRPPPAAR